MRAIRSAALAALDSSFLAVRQALRSSFHGLSERVVDVPISGAIVTASCGLVAAVIAKLRCRFLVSNQAAGESCLERSLACGFTEVRLPQPGRKALEAIPLEEGTLSVKKKE